MTDPLKTRSTTSLDDQLCFALYSATNSVVRAYRPLLDELGLTYPQYLAMLSLWHDGKQTVGELATRMRLPASAISPILDRMVAAGLVSRDRDKRDRRVVHVTLTEAGHELEAAVGEVQTQVACQTTLSVEEISALRDTLIDFTDRMAGEH